MPARVSPLVALRKRASVVDYGLMKLLLYSSYLMAHEHSLALSQLVGKELASIRVAAIANAVDVIPDAHTWVGESRDSLKRHGAHVEAVDLRDWRDNPVGLHEHLARNDVVWLCGGHQFYLRWILRATGADDIIKDLVTHGMVYAGWSAGAVVAGPTLRHFEIFDDPNEAPEVIWDGLGLTNRVVIPHSDLDDFAEGMHQINQQLTAAGVATMPLREDQALIIDGDDHRVLPST